MSTVASWLLLGAIVLALYLLLVGLCIAAGTRPVDRNAYLDGDEPTPADDVAYVDDLAAQLANDQAWARATWFPGGQR